MTAPPVLVISPAGVTPQGGTKAFRRFVHRVVQAINANPSVIFIATHDETGSDAVREGFADLLVVLAVETGATIVWDMSGCEVTLGEGGAS